MLEKENIFQKLRQGIPFAKTYLDHVKHYKESLHTLFLGTAQ